MVRNIKKTILSYIQNIPGWRTNRKIVVFESDDWGSIRMPSKEVYESLLRKGYKVDQDPFLRYDSLASESDLSNLFDILRSFRDRNGNHALLTANTIVANPDFTKIKESGYQVYHYELFTKTLEKYPDHARSFQLWQEGINHKVFRPQFHGREHVNVDKWMHALKNNDSNLRLAFDHNMISISSLPSEMQYDYMEAYDFFSTYEKEKKKILIQEGLALFNSIFGYQSKSFIACCYIWDKEIESVLKENGINYIQGIEKQLQPTIKNNKHSLKNIYHYTGQRNTHQQIFLARNAYFEPSLYQNTDNVDFCLQRMNIAFKLHKPAIISAHRLNFIGGIDIRNRDKNLKLFRQLLISILKKWPDAEFLSTDQLGFEISNELNPYTL
jgi:hypothetical protein